MSVLQVVRGDNATFDIALTQGTEGEPLPLTGLEVTFTARRRHGGPAVIVHTLGEGITVVDELAGTLTLDITPADTFDLDDRPTLVCDVQVNNDDEVRTPWQGKLVVLADVSDAPSS